MIQYEHSPVINNGILGAADRWGPQYGAQGFDSGTPRTRAAKSPDFRRSFDVEVQSRPVGLMGDACFPRSASTNTLSTAGSATALAGQGGSSNNLLGLNSGSTQSLTTQYEDATASEMQAQMQRSFSQLQLAAQAEAASRAGGLASAQHHGSYDSLPELDQPTYRRPSVEMRHTLDSSVGAEPSMVGQGGGAAYPGTSFPGARSMPVPVNFGNREELFHMDMGTDVQPRSRMGRSLSSSNLMQHPSSMLPDSHVEGSRTLLVQNVDPSTTDDELRVLFEPYGEVRSLYTGVLHSGGVIITYYDLRAAALAVQSLHKSHFKGRQLSVTYSEGKEGGKDASEGIVSLMNVVPHMTNAAVVKVLSAYGDVKAIAEHPSIPRCRLAEYYDVRHAELAYQKINASPAKIPTISEDQSPFSADVMAAQAPRLRSQSSSHDALNEWRNNNWDLNTSDPFARMYSHPGMQSNPQFSESTPNMEAIYQEAQAQVQAQAQAQAQAVDFLARQAGLTQPFVPRAPGMSHSASHPNLTMHHRGQSSPTHPGNSGLPSTLSSSQLATSQLALLQNRMNQQVSRMDQATRLPGVASMSNLADLADSSSCASGSFFQNALQRAPQRPVQYRPGSGGGGPSGSNMYISRYPDPAAYLALQNTLALQAIVAQSTGFSPRVGSESALPRMIMGATSHNSSPHLNNGPYGGGAGPHGVRGDPQRSKARGGREDERVGGRLSRRAVDPQAEAERKAQQDRLFALDLDKVLAGEDTRTTLMIKNIPNKYTQKMLLATIDSEFKGQYDFFYLPIDFKNKCNVGYAFINLIEPVFIIKLVERFNNKKWEKFNSEKVCHISYARIQGKANLVTHFQNSSLLHEDKRCRPVLFHGKGPFAGEQEPFPAGPNPRTRGTP